MQKVIDFLPFILLSILTPFFFYREPNIAQALIVAAISGLVGYRYYLENMKLPDYVKIFEDTMIERDKQVNDKMNELIAIIQDVQKKQGAISIVKNQNDLLKRHGW